MSDGLFGLIGVLLGFAFSGVMTAWNRRDTREAEERGRLAARADQENGRLAAREDEAAREVRQALTSVHHLKGGVADRQQTGGPDELYALIHTIDSATLLLASEELRSRLAEDTAIMWHWHVLRSAQGAGHPLWEAADDATKCLGAYLRGETLPERPTAIRSLTIEVEELYAQLEELDGER
ncbi:hypothetical protein ACWDCL_19500 [Streptomyces sp. NPDC001009]